jgi:hypothetical protein
MAEDNILIGRATSTSLLVRQVPNVSYLFYKDYFTAAYFENQNITLIDTLEFSLENNEKAFVFKTQLTIDSINFTRYYIITGDLNKSIVFVLNTLPRVEDRIYALFAEEIKKIKFDE